MNNSALQQKKYFGMAFNEKFKNGKTSGEIIIDGDSFRFITEEESVTLPVHDLKIKQGGAANRLIFFEHKSHPQWSIYTADKSILKDLQQGAKSAVFAQVREIKKYNVKLRTLYAVTFLLIIGIVFALVQLRTPIVKKIAENIPAKWERSLGETAFAQFKLTMTVVDDPEIVADMKTITRPLMEHISSERYKFRVHIVENPMVNAFALPGGDVVLNTGLILNVESAEELLGVLAHEISHVTLQHGVRHIIDSAGLFLIVQAIVGDMSGILAVLTENAAFLLNRKFSRSFEREADEKAFAYLVEANIQPMGIVDFFQRHIEEREKNEALQVVGALEESLDFLSTHPTAKERIELFKKKWELLETKKGFKKFDSQLKQFQDNVRKKTDKQKNQKKEVKNENTT